MTTDDDILAVLNGEPRASKKAATEAIAAVLSGGPSARELALNDAVLEALAGTGSSTAVAVWAAREAAAASTKTLSEAIMREDGSKGIYLAESEAEEIAKEAYAEAAKRSPSEVERQNAVARVTATVSESINRRTGASGRKPGRPAEVAAKAKTTTIENFRGHSRVVK